MLRGDRTVLVAAIALLAGFCAFGYEYYPMGGIPIFAAEPNVSLASEDLTLPARRHGAAFNCRIYGQIGTIRIDCHRNVEQRQNHR